MKWLDNKVYDARYLLKALMWIVLTSIAMKATTGMVAVVFPIVAISALTTGNMVRLFFLFMLMIGAQVGNTFFFPKTFIYVMSVRITLLLLALALSSRLLGRKHSHFVTPFMGMMPYLLWECVSSMQGYAPIVSYLKILLFSVIYFAYYAIANTVLSSSKSDPRKIRSIVLAFACLYVLGSVLLIPFPNISLMSMEDWGGNNTIIYMESLFKGMSMHSQSLGPLVAAFSVLVFGDFVFSVRKMDKLYLAILMACPLLIWKTSSRTALGTYVLGMMMVALFFMKANNVGMRWKGKILSMLWMVSIGVALSVFALPSAREKVMRFVLKKTASTEQVSSADMSIGNIAFSRLGVVEECLYNFKKKPFLGNGFQVQSGMMDNRGNRSFLSYLSAPIEKGVWYAAVLEEGGVVGFMLFVAFLLVAFFSLVKSHAYITASCFFTLTLSNMGEFTFFSMTYTGGLIWAMVFAAAVLDSQRVAQAKRKMREMALRMNMAPMMGAWR